MPSLFDSNYPDPVKIILLGESGAGKSGATAALCALGLRIFMVSTDNGHQPVRALLTDPHYPYVKYMKSQGIEPFFQYVPISTSMVPKTISHNVKVGRDNRQIIERALAPKDGKAWDKILTLLDHWKDPQSGEDFGKPTSWGPDTVLVLDSFTTISRQAYYFNQAFNARLGNVEEGYDHMRDIGGAQNQLRRLLETLFDPELRCHVVLVCHINRIDDSRGVAQTPESIRLNNPDAIIEVKGFPQSVGLQLSKQVGIYFNDSFIVEQSGSGSAVRRTIHTVPTTINGVNVTAKNSVWLERSYPISTGLAEIFCALQGKPPPEDFIRTIRPPSAAPPANSSPRQVPSIPKPAT